MLYRECEKCKHITDCNLKGMVPKITGCTGRSKYFQNSLDDNEVKHDFESNDRYGEFRYKKGPKRDISIGDMVRFKYGEKSIALDLPYYLHGTIMKVVDFNREGKAICVYGKGMPFIAPTDVFDVVGA